MAAIRRFRYPITANTLISAPLKAVPTGAAIQKAAETGESYELTVEFFHPDGPQKWVADRGEAVRDADGNVARLIDTVQDHQIETGRGSRKRPLDGNAFSGEMERVVPWAQLVMLVEPHYPSGQRGRPPIGIEWMLRIYFLQQCYSLAEEALEDTLYDSPGDTDFRGNRSVCRSGRRATTPLKFRLLLERHELTKRDLRRSRRTIIAAPPSTKNASKQRDPEMHQVKKGNEWHFGIKAHIGVDPHSGLVHSFTGTAANVADITQTHALLYGKESKVFADAGYI